MEKRQNGQHASVASLAGYDSRKDMDGVWRVPTRHGVRRLHLVRETAADGRSMTEVVADMFGTPGRDWVRPNTLCVRVQS